MTESGDLNAIVWAIIRNVNNVMNYAVDRLPQAILVVSQDGHLEWCNRQLGENLGARPGAGDGSCRFLAGIQH